ncbi:MAG: methionyl-tRNA formyltransferase [Anaerolineaceae bacterium]|nr:methionyl-tRNA formyltransferase [Anaerolineaceae bacterium]
MNKRIVFMGSPEFAVPILAGLAEQYDVVGVVTQPDRPSGRGKVMTAPPVKVLAQQLQLPILQPLKLRVPEAFEQLAAWKPDAIVVAAFGQILRQNVLDLPQYGCINVHASYLPRWRGAAPIQAAILNGDAYTGVSIMRMDAGIDTGPVFYQEKMDILQNDTADTLSQRLSALGRETLLKVLPQIFEGQLTAQLQNDSKATYVSMIKKEDGLLSWDQPAAALERKIRAYNDWPGAYTTWKEQTLKVRKAEVAAVGATQPGKRVLVHGNPAVLTAEGALVLLEVQPAGKKWMSGKDFLNGASDWQN